MFGKKLIKWGVVVTLSAASCFAGQWDKKTVVDWNEPTLVGSAELSPGRYALHLVDVPGNRHVVQFMNEREDKVFATVLALPNLRLQTTDKSEFSWWETPRGNPRALRAWFYPGDSFGHEFVYPKGLAVKIARDTSRPVLTAPSAIESELGKTPVTEVEKSGKEIPLEEGFVIAAPPAPPAPPRAPVVIAQANPAPPLAPVPVPAPEPIPATASPMFLVGLLGLGAAAVGLAVRKMTAPAS
jgi:hypothetical protein